MDAPDDEVRDTAGEGKGGGMRLDWQRMGVSVGVPHGSLGVTRGSAAVSLSPSLSPSLSSSLSLSLCLSPALGCLKCVRRFTGIK